MENKPRRIVFLTKSRNDSATRYRASLLFPVLREGNWTITHIACDEPWYRLKLLIAANSATVVFIQRRLLQAPVLALLGLLARHLVFDFDDAIFLKSSGKPSTTRETRFAALLSRCSLALAGNEYLAGAARRHCNNVQVAPTAIDLKRYPEEIDNSKTGPALVWIGSRSTSKYLQQYPEIFTALHNAHPELQLKIIADFAWPECPMPSLAVPWSAESEIGELLSARIGIAPMPSNPWTRGKCALKVLQYMAAGLPVVSMRSGANAEVIDDGVTGILADTAEEWCAAITRLLADPALCAQMGAAGRERVSTRFSQEATCRMIVEQLGALCSTE